MEKYLQVLHKLNHINKFRGMKLTLDNMAAMSKVLGHPENDINFIHVAGTNGKGSVTLKLQKSFQAAGYKCGLFTSPHLFTYKERILVNDQKIDNQQIVESLEILFKLAERHKIQLTFFEFLTNVAFMHFKQNKVDLAVLETGIGGILDSTNIIPRNLASVITSIGLDHQGSLGYTYEEIAQKKGGIIKEGCPSIIGPNSQPFQVFADICKQKKSDIFYVQESEQSALDYNLENNLIVQKTIEVIQQNQKVEENLRFLNVSKENVLKGCQAQQLCRMEPLRQDLYDSIYQKMGKQFNLYFDVGHNSAALEKVFTRLQQLHPQKNIKVVYGTSNQKDSLDSLITISKYCEKCFLIQPDHYRSMDIQQLIQNSQQLNFINSNWVLQQQPIVENGNIAKTFDNIFQNSLIEEEDVVLVVGSFFIMREVREYFGYVEEKDPMELNERVIPIGQQIQKQQNHINAASFNV